MGSHSTVGRTLARKRSWIQIPGADRLNIGPRLTLCFIVIILLMLGGNCLLLWQFHLLRNEADSLTGKSQELIAILHLQISLVSFDAKLDELAQAEDNDRLAVEARPLIEALQKESQRASNALTRLPSATHLEPSLVPTLETIESMLPSQLEAITSLATAGDWKAVRLRLANENKPLESQTSGLVSNLDQEVGDEIVQASRDIGRAQRRILIIVPLTAVLTLLIAAFLGWAITHSITQPLGRLLEGSEALARGEFQYQVSVIGKDELAHLSTVFNETAGKLRQLQLAQAQLAHMARLTTMGELAASIAHEVNQPLAAIVANGNACLRWLGRAEPDLEEARTAAERMVRDGRRAGDIIARIRALSKKTATEKESLDVNGIIQEVVGLVQAEVRRNRVALRTALADGLPPVLGDRVQLQQVVLNLMMNGIEAMRPVEDRARVLVIRTQKGDEGQVRVAVQDCGVGLNSENMDRIFDAFYTTKREGMGMGLSISRSIVENHKGQLRVIANDGPGATFEFTLGESR
jgi:signal transduction histidine kinase